MLGVVYLLFPEGWCYGCLVHQQSSDQDFFVRQQCSHHVILESQQNTHQAFFVDQKNHHLAFFVHQQYPRQDIFDVFVDQKNHYLAFFVHQKSHYQTFSLDFPAFPLDRPSFRIAVEPAREDDRVGPFFQDRPNCRSVAFSGFLGCDVVEDCHG